MAVARAAAVATPAQVAVAVAAVRPEAAAVAAAAGVRAAVAAGQAVAAVLAAVRAVEVVVVEAAAIVVVVAAEAADTLRRYNQKLCQVFDSGELFMATERTLSIIKPDAVAKNVIGQIYARFEGAGLKVVAARMAHLSRGEAEAFYAVHKARPFFNDLVSFMISGPVMIQALEGEGAIAKNRELMGATDPKKADKGTIRADFADSIDANAVHGSDAPETAAVEIAFFFPGMNVYSR